LINEKLYPTCPIDYFGGDGGFNTLDKKEMRKGLRIVFYKNIKELSQDPILKQTLGLSLEGKKEFLKKLENQDIKLKGLSLKEYFFIHEKFFEDNRTHMEEEEETQCLKSKTSFDHTVNVSWVSESSDPRLNIEAYADDYSDPYLKIGFRFGKSFEIK